MPEDPERKHGKKAVIPESFIGIGQDEGEQTDLGYIIYLVSGKNMGVQVADLSTLKSMVPTLDLDLFADQGFDPWIFIT